MFVTAFRQIYPDHELPKIGIKTWFLFHQGLMITAFLMTICGLVIIFVYRNGWSETAGKHAYFGVIIGAFSLANIILGFARPHAKTDTEQKGWQHFL